MLGFSWTICFSLFNKLEMYVMNIGGFYCCLSSKCNCLRTQLSRSMAAFDLPDWHCILEFFGGKNDTYLLTHYGFLHQELQNQNSNLFRRLHVDMRSRPAENRFVCCINQPLSLWLKAVNRHLDAKKLVLGPGPIEKSWPCSAVCFGASVDSSSIFTSKSLNLEVIHL